MLSNVGCITAAKSGFTAKEMVMRFSSKWAIPLLIAGMLTAVWQVAAAPGPKNDPTADPAGPIVHEWGTFSTFSGSDGNNLQFYPYDNDLPEFVHGYLSRNSKAGPQGGTISLETPVLYFYADQPLTANVQVEFPKGTMTEWYPNATRTEQKLVWKGIHVGPKDKPELLKEEAKSRYYAARETDAAPLLVSYWKENLTHTEQEKFLFYRGVGDFAMPLTMRARGDGKFNIHWDGKGPWGDLLLVQVQAGKIRFRQFGLDHKADAEAGADVQVPDQDATPEQLSDAMVKLLIEKGLYEKEARAMVKTWSDAWFNEEGTRVLYILPERLTDELLPLWVSPRPSALLRVLVGRHDVLTPEREKRIDSLVSKLDKETSTQDADKRVAQEEMAKLGRYASPAWTEAETRLKNRR